MATPIKKRNSNDDGRRTAEAPVSLVEYLRDRFHPSAIVLAGSRASGYYQQHSDWDLIIFEDGIHGVTRILEETSWGILDVQRIPSSQLSAGYVFKTPNTPFRVVEILYDSTGGALRNAVENTRRAYAHGPAPMTREAVASRRNYLLKKVMKLREATRRREVFLYFLGPFYQSVILTWFQIRQEWPLKVQEALPHIEDQDKPFYEALSSLSSNIPLSHKVASAELLIQLVFETRS